MARPKKDIDEKLLLSRYLEGATSRQLANEFHISQQTVLNRINQYVDISIVVRKTIKSF
jgi:DNA-binding transcriptional regulator LsrR (DeoR family)